MSFDLEMTKIIVMRLQPLSVRHKNANWKKPLSVWMISSENVVLHFPFEKYSSYSSSSTLIDILIFAALNCSERVGSCGRYRGTLNHYTIMNPASRNYCSMQQQPTRFSSMCLLCKTKRCVWCVSGGLWGGLFVSACPRCPQKGAGRQIRKMAAPCSSDWMSQPDL